jgi:hypothetical protein
MESLTNLGVQILEPDPKHLDELIATKEGLQGRIFHTFVPTKPVTHISAIYQCESDLIELRLIRESIELNESAFGETDEELVAMKVSDQWQRSIETS